MTLIILKKIYYLKISLYIENYTHCLHYVNVKWPVGAYWLLDERNVAPRRTIL